jgi:hypothetical protein
MHETGHRYRLKCSIIHLLLYCLSVELRFLIITLVSSNCSFTSITINRTNGMQFRDPSTETSGDKYIYD